MLNKLILSSIFFFIPVLSFSQKIITGKVISQFNEPLEHCTIQIWDSLSKNILNSSLTNTEGKFSLSIAPPLNNFGLYIIVSHIGFKEAKFLLNKEISSLNDSVNVGTIVLLSTANELNEVTVIGNYKTIIKNNGNEIEFLPGKALNQSHLNVFNIIKSVPALVYDGTDVLIRGRKLENVYLHNSDSSPGIRIGTQKLKGIPAKDIKRMVVLFNETELHIYLKDKIGYELNVNTTISKGRKWFGSIVPGFQLNTVGSSLKIYDNNNIDVRQTTSNGFYMSKGLNNKVKFSDISAKIKMNNQKINPYFIYEKKLPGNFILGMQVDMQPGKNTFSGFTNVVSDSGFIKSVLKSTKRFFTIVPNFYFQKSMDSGKLVLSGNMGFGYLHEKKTDNNQYSYKDSILVDNFSQKLNQQNKSFYSFGELAVTKKITQKINLKLSTQLNTLDLSSNNSFFQDIISMPFENTNFKDQFNETQVRVSGNVDYILKNSMITGSLQMFSYDYTAEAQDTKYDYNFLKLLPSFNYSFKVKKERRASIFFNTTIRPPDIHNYIFNNFSSDGVSVNKNNPFLNPYTTYQTGFSMPFSNSLMSTVYYNHVLNKVMNIAQFGSAGEFLGNRLINLTRENDVAFSLSHAISISNSFFFSTSATFTYAALKQSDSIFNFLVSYSYVIVNNSFYYTSRHGLSISTNLLYVSSQKIGNTLTLKGLFEFDMGCSQSVGKHFNIFLKVNDIFNSYKPSIISANKNISYKTNANWDYRTVAFGFVYHFDKHFKKQKLYQNNIENINNRLLN